MHRPLKANLCFDHFDDFAAFVFAAMWTGAMGADFLVAIGALGQLGDAQRIVRTARGGSALRMAPFGIRHGSSLLLIKMFVEAV
jgi:hypothetical protein